MASVPYDEGVPSVQPTEDSPQDTQRIDANPTAFGSQIAGATEKLGTAANDVGQFFGQVQTDDAVNTAMTSVNQQLDHYRSLSGADALRAQQPTQQAIDEAFQQGREGLDGPRQQYLYDQTVRSFQQRYVNGIISSHADQQAKTYATETNANAVTLGLQGVANVADDPDKVESFKEDVRRAAVRTVQLQGNGSDPTAVNAAIARADQSVYKTQAETIAVKDPARALALVESKKDVLGQYYAPLADSFRGRSEEQNATGAADRAVSSVGLTVMPPPTPNAVVPVTQVHSALIGQESSGNPNAPTSMTGATGIGQIQPATFDQYKLPGEDIHNPADNLAVSKRIVNDLYEKAGGDPQRVAVGYFSGPGNMAPPGSPTPWIRDVPDPTGKTTSSYVSDVMGRINTPAVTTKGDAYAAVLADTSLNPREQQLALSKISQRVSAAQIASMSSAQAQKDASDKAEGAWVPKILTNPAAVSVDDIANDPSLNPQSKILMSNLLREHLKGSDDGTAATYGPKFYDTLKAVTAPPGDPARISDQNQILQMALPGGGLTLSGADKLNEYIAKGKTAEGSADNAVKSGIMAYAKHQISFEADYGTVKIRDPAGEDKFNIGFIPAFEAYWKNGIANNKTPQELADPKAIDNLAAPFKRPAAQLARDSQAAGLDAADSGKAPAVPALPPGVPHDALFSPSRNQFRDSSGKLYDATGKPL